MRRRLWTALFLVSVACSRLNGDAHPPRLNQLDNYRVMVGEKLTILVSATDPDGDELTFKIAGRPERALFIAREDGRSALFTWVPEVQDAGTGEKDYVIEFFVVDNRGEWDSQEVVVTVVARRAAAFLNPPGYVLDLAKDNYIEFLVQVKDDAASQVDIRLASGPQAAYLEQIGKKSAYFFWRPEPQQIAEKPFWYARFNAVGLASDPFHPGQQIQLYTLTHDIAIVLTNAHYAGCPGSPPAVKHEPLPDQHSMGETQGYVVKAAVFENESYVQRVTLFWTTGNPDDNDAYQISPMTSLGGTSFSATIPKFPAGAGKFAHYYIEAWDADDYASSICDHVTRVPKHGYFSFVAYDTGHSDECLDDTFEDNDSVETATQLQPPGVWSMLRLCGVDEDFFTFQLLSPEVEVAVLAQGNGSDLVTEVLDGWGKSILAKQRGSGSISMPLSKLPGGLLLLRFYSESGKPVTYSLTVTGRDEGCVADSLESNDTSSKASLLGTGKFQELTLCAGDFDWYRLEVPAGILLSALIEHAAAQGDLDLYLFDKDAETVLASGETSSNIEKVQYNVTVGGTYYLKVIGFQGSTNIYNLIVTFTPLAEECQEDSFAPNHYPDEAAMVPPGLYKQLVACAGKEDWFAIGLNGGEKLSVGLSGSTSDLMLKLFDSSGSLLCSGLQGGGKSVISCDVPAPGNYAILVNNPAGSTTVYDMQISVFEDMSTCKDDRFEENDTPDMGAEVQYSTTTCLKSCGADADWFHFAGYPKEYVFVELLYDHQLGPLDVQLYDEAGVTLLASSHSKQGDPLLEYELTAVGTYQICVKGESNTGNIPYSLFVWTQ